MCKFFVLYDPNLFNTWADLAMVGYKKYCKQGILSAGLVEVKEGAVVRQRSIPPQECFPDQHPTLTYPNGTVFDHRREICSYAQRSYPFQKKCHSAS